ncbi:MAG: pre-16S rRNA-processing nuclease YqgF [Cyanobacteria bacterium P01_F01_bin.143]
MILGFDPGRDKCGVAVADEEVTVHYHQVIESAEAIAIIKQLSQKYSVNLIVMGNLTTAKTWHQKLVSNFANIPIVMVDENNSSLEARDRYWQIYPAQGLRKLIPQSLRIPPCPIDDIVAILLIERYLQN